MGSMNRKHFLKTLLQGSTLLSVPTFLQYCSSLPQTHLDAKETSSDSILMHAIAYGIMAANAHNTQPWKFRIATENELFLYVDEKRLLLQTDPSTRQIHISQGTFLEQLQIAALAKGYLANITLFPEGKYPIEKVGKKPVAYIKLERLKQASSPSPLYEMIPIRATNRSEYMGPAISSSEWKSITELVGTSYSQFHFHNLAENIQPFVKLFSQAYTIEANTFAKNEESRIWFRYNDEEIYTKRDGISLRGNALSGWKYWFVSTFILQPGQKAWHEKSNVDAGIEIFNNALGSSKALGFLQTKENELEDWVLCGRDYSRLQLAVCKLGLVLQPMSQILQEYPEMDRLRKEFEEMVGVQKKEKVQMIVRLGRSDYNFVSPRRKPSSMMI